MSPAKVLAWYNTLNMKHAKHGFIYHFIVRWLACGLGLWVAAGILNGVDFTGGLWVVVWAGLLLAIINSIVRPVLIFLSIPALLITLGLFLIVINGFTVWLVSWLYTPFVVEGFWSALLAGLLIGLVNFLVTAILDNKERS